MNKYIKFFHCPALALSILTLLQCNSILAQSLIQENKHLKYIGNLTNTTYNIKANVVIDVLFEPRDKISGYFNLTNNHGEGFLCGAGLFTGSKQGQTIQFEFISNDIDPGCAWDKGIKFVVNATLSQNGERLENGTYKVNNAQGGIFFAETRKVANNRKIQADQLIQDAVQAKQENQTAIAIKKLQEAKKIYQSLNDKVGKAFVDYYEQINSFDIDLNVNDVGSIYNDSKELQKALKYLSKSLTLYQALGDNLAECDVLSTTADIYQALGANQKALESLSKAGDLSKLLNNHLRQAIIFGKFASIYNMLGNKQKALEYFQSALFLSDSLNKHLFSSDILTSIGHIYVQQGDNKQANKYFSKALSLSIAYNYQAGKAAALGGLGNIYLASGENQKALENFESALKAYDKLGYHTNKTSILLSIGYIHSILGKKSEALKYFNQALSFQKIAKNPQAKAYSAYTLGRFFVEQKQFEQAIFFYKQYVDIIESLRKDIHGLDKNLQQTYTQSIVNSYRELATLLFQQKRPIEALQVLDLLKVQELQDFLKDVKGNELTAQGVELLPAEQTLLNTLNITPDFNLQTWIDSSSTKSQIARIQTEAKDQTQLATYKDLQTRLQTLSKDSALFYPLILPDRIELVVLLPNQPPIHKTVPVKQEELKENIDDYKRYATSASSFKLTKEVSAQLYDWLIKPIAAELKQANIKTIVYAPDGALRYVPLAGLYDGKRWLIEDYQVNYVTAFSLTSLNKPKNSNPKVLAGAYTDTTLPLPNALTEIKAISKEFPQAKLLCNQNRDFICNQDFNRAAFTPERLNQFNFIHLATHGKLDPKSPELSFISFNPNESISLKEIQNWQLPNVNLVTLSACQSSLGGKESNGIEVLGFGYQFQLAKVDATISTLWTINDNATSQLMQRFYQYLKQGQSPNAALRQAQIDLIQGTVSSESQNLSHPLYWAPFILVGNGF